MIWYQRMKNKNYLKHIKLPEDLKKLKISQLKPLAEEIRKLLLTSVSVTGGHLSSNLGAVELTIALHYVFNSPKDKIVWDVGHQSYVHKILTGRAKSFCTLRKSGGLSGFTRPSESVHDAVVSGHSSTSVSSALGIACARDLRGENFDVVAVIGDGSLTGGLAYEGLNNAASATSRLIVVLNDNEMSISKNVGALSTHLAVLRSNPSYLNVKKEVKKVLDRSQIGRMFARTIGKAKTNLKYLVMPNVFFEEMGFTYVGAVDGHNITELVNALKTCRQFEGPVLLHVKTQKGKGYEKAEKSPEYFHGVERFDLETGEPLYEKGKSFTSVFGETIVSLAEKNDKIVAVTAAMTSGTGLSKFSQKFPDRFFDVGIAEAHAVTFCAGLATQGLKPVFAVYSTFLQRAYDQIIHDVCIANLPVVFAIDRAGIVGADGETHQGVFDLSFLSHIPNMTVFAPKNAAEMRVAFNTAFLMDSPVAVRYPRGCAIDEEYTCDMTEPEIFSDGERIAVVTVGEMFYPALEACEQLNAEGIFPALINVRQVFPISEKLLKILEKFDLIFTVENNTCDGGFGQKLNCAIS
ncbi:MAG: 1-deoxy-D-xylulose-5-phosphate synthase, partial [Clostridiales bacterium]|nr:1-deoxy-D-xylulose-5-phosphate synthase [Clostridiales bacterium]